MSDEKRYVPIPYRKRVRAYARNPQPHLATLAELKGHAHALQHEAGQLFRVTEPQAEHSLTVVDKIKEIVTNGLVANKDRLGLTDMQAHGLAINIGWALIVGTVDQLRHEHDPLSRVAYMTELLRHLQTRTWTSTEERIYDTLGDGDEDKGQLQFPALEDHAATMLHHLLDNEALGDYEKAYDHASALGVGRGGLLDLLREALGVPPEAAPEPAAAEVNDTSSVAAELAGLGGLGQLGALLQALDKMPRPEPKPAAPERKPGKRSDGAGMLAIEIRKGEGPEEFHARLIQELTAKGMDEANAKEMADAVMEHIIKGMGLGDKDDDHDDE